MSDLLALLDGNITTLPQRADRVRSLVSVARGCIVEIGRELIEAKRDIPHGQWLPWLETEFGWALRTAQNYMQAAEAFKYATVAHFSDLTIDATALYALAAPDVPQAARDAAVEQAEAGEHITREHADKLIADAEKAMAQQLRAAIDQERMASAERLVGAVAKARAHHARDTEALQQALTRLQTEQREPDVAQAVEILCKILGKPKLNAKQMQLVAQVLDATITDGKRTYPPVPEADMRRAEENMRIASAADRAIEYFAGAPDPRAVREAAIPSQRAKADRMIAAAIAWLIEYQTVSRED